MTLAVAFVSTAFETRTRTRPACKQPQGTHKSSQAKPAHQRHDTALMYTKSKQTRTSLEASAMEPVDCL